MVVDAVRSSELELETLDDVRLRLLAREDALF